MSGRLETLRRNREFQQALRAGKSCSGREFVLYGHRPSRPQQRIRFGFCVSRKVGGAVQRNRIRRRLKEICRLHRSQLRPGWDLVFVVRSEAGESDYQRLESAFQQQARRVGCWREPT